MYRRIQLRRCLTNNRLIFSFLILSFIFDFIDKIELFYGLDFIKFNFILKLIFIIYASIFMITHIKYSYKEIKYIFYILIILLSVILIKYKFFFLYLNEYIRYFFLLLVIPLIFYTYRNNKKELLLGLYSIFKLFVVINIALIILGILFDIQAVKVYRFSRFGYNGMLLSQGYTPYVYLAATSIFWYMKDKKMLSVIFILSIISGIKGVYFAEFMLVSLLVFFDKKIIRALRLKFLIALTFIFVTLIIVLFTMSPFKELINEKGLLSAIFSRRTDYLLDLINEITSDNFSFLIGSTGLEKVRLELQFVDIFLVFGVIGFVTYIIFIYKLNKTLESLISKIFLATALLLSALSGNLFYIPMSSCFFILTLLSLSTENILVKERIN